LKGRDQRHFCKRLPDKVVSVCVATSPQASIIRLTRFRPSTPNTKSRIFVSAHNLLRKAFNTKRHIGASKMAVIDSLRNCELLRNLEPKHLEKIAPLCRGSAYREGTTVFKERDQAKEFYLLTDGRVVLEMDVRPVPDRPAIPTAVEVVEKGDAFGWSALVEPYVYTMSARCLTNCQVLALRGDVLRRVMDDDANLGYELMKRLAKLVALRLTYTRLRLTSGLGLALLGRET